MKLLILLAFFTTAAFAAETKTECPWMKEMMSRTNPKANFVSGNMKIKASEKSSVTTRQ